MKLVFGIVVFTLAGQALADWMDWKDFQLITGQFREVADVATNYLAANVDVYGQFIAPNATVDLCYYYKLPLSLFYAGHFREANRVLDFIKANFLRTDGDFRTSDTVKTCSGALDHYYHYTNGWILLAAHLMGRFDIAEPAYAYLETYFGSWEGAQFTINGPVDEGHEETDMFTAAHFGMISLYRGDLNTAKRAGQVILKILQQQPDMDSGLYMRMGSDGQVITENYDTNWTPFYFLNRTTPFQLYFLIGYPAVFLAKLSQATNNSCYVDAATSLLEWSQTCDPSIYSFHFSHKIGLAASYVASITKDEEMVTYAERIAAFLLNTQNSDGTFLSYSDFAVADIYDQSAEIALWLRIIDGNLFYVATLQ